MSDEKRRKPRHSAAPRLPETRQMTLAPDEMQVDVDSIGSRNSQIGIGGYALRWSDVAKISDAWGTYSERMMPTVGDGVVSRRFDTRLLVGHNHGSLPLARVASGSLRFFTDSRGLRFEADLDSRSQMSNDLALALSRGDLDGVSVGFECGRDDWSANMDERTIHEFADLAEISVVCFPAYEGTSAGLREAMHAALPPESRARIRRLYTGAKAGKLSDEEVGMFRSLLYAGLDEDQVPAEPAQREADPRVLARLQLEASRRRRQKLLLAEIGLRQRRRPTV